jgi:hypothetical protein
MSGSEIDTLYRLAREYPHGLEAGDTPSKVGRDSLIARGLAEYHDGVTYLNRKGYEVYVQRRAAKEAKQNGDTTRS